ncbi:MAG: aldo/keto reductase [Ignavibacteriales bacterium]|nr:aldo/keto reductase [Ignavibacteriales bacterium]
MKTRKLGTNGPDLTVIGFGAWAIGGPWVYGWGPVDDRESIAAIHAALDAGINWIDTAAAYGFGHSETIVGRALKGMRGKAFVATKGGLVPDGKGDVYRNSRPESIRTEIEESLLRLQTDHVDLYQIHWPDVGVPFEDSWETMVRLREEGKARFIGVSNYDVAALERCHAISPAQSLQPPYSMLTREVESEILPYCLKRGIGVLAYSPMQSGLLSGTFDKSRLAPDDWRHKFHWFQEPNLSAALEFVEDLRPMAAKYEATVGQLAIQWVLADPAVTCAIVGARRPRQIIETIRAADLLLSREDLDYIRHLMKQRFDAKD